MKGGITVNVIRKDGQIAQINFDNATLINLYIRLDLKNNGVSPINIDTVKQAFTNAVTFTIDQAADNGNLTSVLVGVLSNLGINATVSNLQISLDNAIWVSYLSTPLKSNIWSVMTTNITINLI